MLRFQVVAKGADNKFFLKLLSFFNALGQSGHPNIQVKKKVMMKKRKTKKHQTLLDR